jgi:hypothetical protein
LISEEALKALQDALCGSYTLPIGNGEEARMICAPLPGRAIAVTARVRGVLVVCLDLDKPSAPGHARAMLEEWREKFLGDVVIPTQRTGPCPLSLTAA